MFDVNVARLIRSCLLITTSLLEDIMPVRGMRIPKNLDERLHKLSAATKRPLTYHSLNAIEQYLDKYEKELVKIAKLEQTMLGKNERSKS